MPEERNPAGQSGTSEDAHATASVPEDNPSASGWRPIDALSRISWYKMPERERREWLYFAAEEMGFLLVPADPARMSGAQAKTLVAALTTLARVPGAIWDLPESVRQVLLESLWGAPRALPGGAKSRCRRVWNLIEAKLTSAEKRRLGEQLVADANYVDAAQTQEAADA